MATRNHSPNAVTGIRPVIRLFRKNPKPVSKKDENPKTRFLDVIDSFAKIIGAVAAVVTPIAVVIIGGYINATIDSQNRQKDLLQTAVGILENKVPPEEMQRTKPLREWAVYVLNTYSPKPMDPKVLDEMVNGQFALPLVQTNFGFIFPDPMPHSKPAIPKFIATSVDKKITVTAKSDDHLEIIDETKAPPTIITTNTGVASPTGIVFSADDHYLLVYNETCFSIFDNAGEWLRALNPNGMPVIPPAGIASVKFPNNDEIVVTSSDGKETQYNLQGKEIKQ
jgi:hypothetical protein